MTTKKRVKVKLLIWILFTGEAQQDELTECVHRPESNHADKSPCTQCSLHLL